MIDKRILSIRKFIANWENRILAITGVNPCKCPNCRNKMRFHDIVYPKYGAMREWLIIKIISENENKLEEALENYAITKRILSSKIILKKTQLEEIKLQICTIYRTNENISKEVAEYFDEMDQSNIDEPPCFSCERCREIMRIKEYTVVD